MKPNTFRTGPRTLSEQMFSTSLLAFLEVTLGVVVSFPLAAFYVYALNEGNGNMSGIWLLFSVIAVLLGTAHSITWHKNYLKKLDEEEENNSKLYEKWEAFPPDQRIVRESSKGFEFVVATKGESQIEESVILSLPKTNFS